jgi:fucose permease
MLALRQAFILSFVQQGVFWCFHFTEGIGKDFFCYQCYMYVSSYGSLFIFNEKMMIYACIALIGFGNSNIFPIIFSKALLSMPQKKNEISGLMIMGLFGGTIFPIAMGMASDAVGQSGAVAVMTVGVIYLFFYMLKIKH